LKYLNKPFLFINLESESLIFSNKFYDNFTPIIEVTVNYFKTLSELALVITFGPLIFKNLRILLDFSFTNFEFIFFKWTTGAIATNNYNLSLKKSVFWESPINIYCAP
jgi:hypothetical protein